MIVPQPLLAETSAEAMLLTQWTARLMVACYVASLAAMLGDGPRSWRWARAWSTAAAVVLALHTVIAIVGVHGGSHHLAWEHTRQVTLARTGWDSGAGLAVNYLTLGLWVFDTLAWWIWPAAVWRRSCQRLFHIYLGFMMLQATVVFGPSGWGPAAGVAGVILVVLAVRRRVRHDAVRKGCGPTASPG